MKRILIWDIPTRLFHVLLAAAFIGAFVIANVVDDDSSAFKLHMLLGGIMAFMVVLRLIWGVIGSRWSRFGSFAFGPRAVLEYMQGLATGAGKRYAGHNPGASWAIYAMLALTLGLAITGVSMGTGSEAAEELHEVFAFALAAVVVAHVLGVVLHTVRHRENLVAGMIHGYKEGEPEEAIARSHPVVGLLFLGLTGAWTYSVVASYDAATSQVTLPLLGTVIAVDEGEADDRDDEADESP